MLPDNREELMKYRLEMAEERLKFSKILLDAGSYKDSIGRSYYAMFTAVRALLAIDGQDFRNNTDYADFFIVSVQDAQEQYERAKEFFEMIKTYLQNNERVQNHLLFIHMGVLLWQKSVQAITCATVITKFLLSVINTPFVPGGSSFLPLSPTTVMAMPPFGWFPAFILNFSLPLIIGSFRFVQVDRPERTGAGSGSPHPGAGGQKAGLYVI